MSASYGLTAQTAQISQTAQTGIAKDWPVGRGCYQSADSGFIIWFGEEDQIRIMCMRRGVVLNTAYDLVKVHGHLLE